MFICLSFLNLISEIWREFIGYDIDLDLTSVILSPHTVSNGNDYSELTDGDLETCVQLGEMSCHGLKVGFIIREREKVLKLNYSTRIF